MVPTSHPARWGQQARCSRVPPAGQGHAGGVSTSHPNHTGTRRVPSAHPATWGNASMARDTPAQPPQTPLQLGTRHHGPNRPPLDNGDTPSPIPPPPTPKGVPGMDPRGRRGAGCPSPGEGTVAEGTGDAGGDGGRGHRDALSDAHGAGVLGAAALVDGDGEAALAVGAGGDGHEGDGVRDAGGRGVRQDLLDHRCHHHLVVAVAAAGSGAGG